MVTIDGYLLNIYLFTAELEKKVEELNQEKTALQSHNDQLQQRVSALTKDSSFSLKEQTELYQSLKSENARLTTELQGCQKNQAYIIRLVATLNKCREVLSCLFLD